MDLIKSFCFSDHFNNNIIKIVNYYIHELHGVYKLNKPSLNEIKSNMLSYCGDLINANDELIINDFSNLLSLHKQKSLDNNCYDFNCWVEFGFINSSMISLGVKLCNHSDFLRELTILFNKYDAGLLSTDILNMHRLSFMGKGWYFISANADVAGINNNEHVSGDNIVELSRQLPWDIFSRFER